MFSLKSVFLFCAGIFFVNILFIFVYWCNTLFEYPAMAVEMWGVVSLIVCMWTVTPCFFIQLKLRIFAQSVFENVCVCVIDAVKCIHWGKSKRFACEYITVKMQKCIFKKTLQVSLNKWTQEKKSSMSESTRC